ncbi:MAG: hypothetical protein JJ905_11690 [Psychroserpens sp.]|nr:hypothetical protein [Psychroserpens sp.]MBO6632076.1 hypothetical protein [Psychroserpens sp.]MBO6654247.1 hypothetical protein [Psychroserpens sp.]MBO6682467.1 hypothetical protein [Psychroserpens sp.]MBO6750873.1 hypothetical protein [Psychroserpens sp.]
MLLFFSCNTDKTTSDLSESSTEETVQNKTPLEGAWELIGYHNYADNKVIDSFNTSPGYRQVKMYTPTKVMWSKYTPADSSEWFGYGSYRINGNELTEILEYGSQRMSEIIEEKKEFKHELIINGDTFSQIEIDEEGNMLYAENYKRIE